MADIDMEEMRDGGVSADFDEYELQYGDPDMPRDDTDILQLDGTPDIDTGYPDIPDDDQMSYPYDPDAPQNGDENEMDNHQAELSADGVLDEDTIAQGLSNLARSADGTQQVFIYLTIPGYSLKDISLLNEYVHLQKLEVPYNEITDLSSLSNMPHLLQLDVSHNCLTTLLDFEPPKNLKTVDLSYNDIKEMTDLSAHHYLNKLVLDHNSISEIAGLRDCGRLCHLSLSHNKISKIEGLDRLPIKFLDLSFNELKQIDNLETLQNIQNINLSGNKIRSMNGLQGHEFLETVDMEDNEIIDLSEVQYIRTLSLLRVLNLQRNPIRELPDYRLSILFYIQQLTELDRRRVDVEEKVAATNMFNPPLEVMAARDHIMHVVYSFLQPSRVLDSTLPSIETPYPTLILVGPQGAGKTDLALKLVEEFSDYFGYGITHTTRRPHKDEVQGKDHHFVSLEEFEEAIKMGRFLYSYSYNGDLYALALEAIEKVAREGLACVVPMELEGVLTLKNTYLEPRYVLLLPMEAETHERRLREKAMFTEAQIQTTLGRKELYAEYNREHPGFFDMMIASDDIVEAYKQLRRLVMEYLGVRAPTPSVSDFEPSRAGSMIEKEGTMDTITGHSNLVRQWSKHSIPDSLSQALTNLKVKSAASPMPTVGRGIVEEQSLQRRQSAAKQAVTGHVPSIYEQLLQQAPRTVPQQGSDQLGLGENGRASGFRSYSAPAGKENMDALPPSSPDSSISGAGSNSDLSNISEARDMDPDEPASPEGSIKGSEKDLVLPTEALDRIELLSGSGSKNLSGSVPLAPRPGSGAQHPEFAEGRPASGASSRANSRLGSERHIILPPISQEVS